MKRSSPSQTGVQLPPVSKSHVFPFISMQYPSKQWQICGWLNIKPSSFTYPARDLSKTTVDFNPTLTCWQAVKSSSCNFSTDITLSLQIHVYQSTTAEGQQVPPEYLEVVRAAHWACERPNTSVSCVKLTTALMFTRKLPSGLLGNWPRVSSFSWRRVLSRQKGKHFISTWLSFCLGFFFQQKFCSYMNVEIFISSKTNKEQSEFRLTVNNFLHHFPNTKFIRWLNSQTPAFQPHKLLSSTQLKCTV